MLIKTTRNQIPPVRMAILTSLQMIYVGESREEQEILIWLAERSLATATRTDSLCRAGKKKKKLRELTLGSDIPISRPISWKHIIQNSHHPNIHFNTTYKSQDKDPAECPLID